MGQVVCGVYARKSTDEPGKDPDAKSVARQLTRAREFAAKRGWRFDERCVFSDDGISGAEFRRRPGLQRLLAALHKPKFQVLVISEPSRLGREQIETAWILKQIVDGGVRVFSYLDGEELRLGSAIEKFVQSVAHFASESERESTSRRVRDKMLQLHQQGRSTGGRLYGYEVAGGQRAVKPGEARVVMKIFKHRAEGWGYYRIANGLNAAGLPSPRGARWSPTQVGSILANQTYRGVVVWGRTRAARRRGTAVTERSPESTVERAAPDLRIVDEKLWSTAQRMNAAAREATWRDPVTGRLKSKPTSSPSLLAPFASCGVCSGPMHARQTKKHVQVLVCTNSHRYGRAACPSSRAIPAKFLERFVIDRFQEALAAQVVMDLLDDALEAQRAAAVDSEPLEREAKRLRAAVSRLVRALADGEVEEIHQELAARKGRLAQVEAELSGVSAVPDGAAREHFAAAVRDVAADWRAHLMKNKATAQQVLRKIMPSRMVVTPDPATRGWDVEIVADYKKLLAETGGLGAVLAALRERGVVAADAELPHEAKHPAGECRPEYACWTGTKPSSKECPPCR